MYVYTARAAAQATDLQTREGEACIVCIIHRLHVLEDNQDRANIAELVFLPLFAGFFGVDQVKLYSRRSRHYQYFAHERVRGKLIVNHDDAGAAETLDPLRNNLAVNHTGVDTNEC